MARAKKPKSTLLSTDITVVPIGDLETYDRNPRLGNIDKIAQSLEANGQFKPIVVQRSTNQVLAGNHTFMAARKLGWGEIAVTYVEVDDLKAKEIVLADNRTSEEGGYQQDVLGELLAEVLDAGGSLDATGYESDEADDLLAELVANDYDPDTLTAGDELDDTPTQLAGTSAFKPDVIFPARGNYLDIPDLLPDLIPDLTGLAMEVWAGQDMADEVEADPDYWVYVCRDISAVAMPWEQTVMAFYTDDHRFEDAWEKPDEFVSRMVNREVPMAIEPDYSLWYRDPLAVQAWAMYRSRWCGRYWQEAGIPVIPNMAANEPKNYDLSLTGLPEEPNSVAFGWAHAGADDQDMIVGQTNAILERIHPKSVLVYGSDAARRAIEATTYTGPVIMVEPVTRKRRRILDARRGITDMAKL